MSNQYPAIYIIYIIYIYTLSPSLEAGRGGGQGGIAQWEHLRFSPRSPGFDSRRSQEFFPINLDAAEMNQWHFLESVKSLNILIKPSSTS